MPRVRHLGHGSSFAREGYSSDFINDFYQTRWLASSSTVHTFRFFFSISGLAPLRVFAVFSLQPHRRRRTPMSHTATPAVVPPEGASATSTSAAGRWITRTAVGQRCWLFFSWESSSKSCIDALLSAHLAVLLAGISSRCVPEGGAYFR